MLAIIRRFGIQAAFIATLCACGNGGGGDGDKAKPEYKGPVEGFIADSTRKEMCDLWDRAEMRVRDEAEIRFPNARAGNTVVDQWKTKKMGLYALAICDKFGVTFDQFCNVLNEGKSKGWTVSDRIPHPVDTASARQFEKEEASAKAAKETKAAEEKRIAEAKAAEEKRLAARTPEQKAKDEADRIAKEKADAAAELVAKKEADRLAAEKAEAARLWKIKADADAAIAKKAQDELDAQKLYDKVTARIHLLEIIEKYPGTRAAIKAKERLDKLDKKK